MAVLADIRAGKGLKPITNCFTCKNDNCIASGAKTATYQCPVYNRKETNADRIRSMSDEELAIWLDTVNRSTCSFAMNKSPCDAKKCPCWLDWLKQEA